MAKSEKINVEMTYDVRLTLSQREAWALRCLLSTRLKHLEGMVYEHIAEATQPLTRILNVLHGQVDDPNKEN